MWSWLSTQSLLEGVCSEGEEPPRGVVGRGRSLPPVHQDPHQHHEAEAGQHRHHRQRHHRRRLRQPHCPHPRLVAAVTCVWGGTHTHSSGLPRWQSKALAVHVRGSTPTGRERHDHCQGCWFYSLSISTGRHTHADTHMQKQTQTHTHASSHIGHENLPSKPREATVNATCTCTQTCTQAHSRTHTHTSAHLSSSQLRVTHAHMFAVR